jgi:hypothetical protein
MSRPDAELECLTPGAADGSISRKQATQFLKVHVTE